MPRPIEIREIANGFLLESTYYENELELLDALVRETADAIGFKGDYGAYDKALDFATGAMEEREELIDRTMDVIEEVVLPKHFGEMEPDETFSTPVSVQVGDEVLEGTANFKVTRTDTLPENFKGDLLEVSPLTPEPTLADLATGKKRGCGNCGEVGHNRKTCTNAAVSRSPKYQSPKATTPVQGLISKPKTESVSPDWYYQDILDMLRDGMSEGEIYAKVYMSVTTEQFRTALEWAKTQIDA